MPGDLAVSNGLQLPSTDQFVHASSQRVVSAFFLGWLFLFSCERLVQDPALATFLTRIFNVLSRRRIQLHDDRPQSPIADEKSNATLTAPSTSNSRIHRHHSKLSLSMVICFVMAALAQAISLGNFNAANDSAACGFLVAWGGMAAQSARIIGVLRLSFDLVALGIKRWRLITLWSWLCAALVLMFVANAINIGTLVDLDFMPGTALCSRKHFLPTSITLSIINIMLEVFCFVEFFLLAAPAFLHGADRLRALSDIGVRRALSLLLLDVLTIAPSAEFISISADFVPFCIGGVFVLMAFTNVRSRHDPRASHVQFPSTTSQSPPQGRTSSLSVAHSRMSLGSLVRPPATRMERSLPPTPRHSARSEFPVLHITASPLSPRSRQQDDPPRSPPPPGLTVPTTSRAQELLTTRARESVISPGSMESGTLEPAVVRLAYREAMQAMRRDNYAPWNRTSVGPTPLADARASPTSNFASPRTSMATTLGHTPAPRASDVPSLPPMVELPKISVRLPASDAGTDRSISPLPPPTPSAEVHSPAGSSVIFGSDVVRRQSDHRLSLSVSTPGGRTSFDSGVALPPSALYRNSTMSSTLPRPSEDLGVVYEGASEISALDTGQQPSAHPTFGRGTVLSSRWSDSGSQPSRSDGSQSHPSPSKEEK
ncbi:hypothetical protein AURDEDRAFT_110417 [Auricularia subglabra TFB-10046 SS5]|nr:hypothetical protein AURDEDRAFT_110417 [Auricularia subglabra TFB-10046 SS5]